MRLGISTKVLRDFSLREAIEVAHEFGYQEIEFWVDDLLTTDISVEEVIHLTDTYGIGRSVHLLTEDLNLASFNESIRQESVRQEMEGLRLAARLGARTATLHPGRKTAKTRKTEEAWHQQLLSIDALAQCAEDCGVTLCVEAMERLGGEFVLTGTDLDYIHTALGRKELAYTLDIAHLHTVGDVCEQLELARHLPVKNVHISQSKGTKPHLTLFDPEGEIDFRQALEKLGEFYDGALIIEGYVAGKGREIAEKSMKWYRRITANQEEKISQEGVISMATIRGFSVKDSIDVAVKSGCSGIEIQTDYLPEAESERAEVFAYARQQGLYVSLHEFHPTIFDIHRSKITAFRNYHSVYRNLVCILILRSEHSNNILNRNDLTDNIPTTDIVPKECRGSDCTSSNHGNLQRMIVDSTNHFDIIGIDHQSAFTACRSIRYKSCHFYFLHFLLVAANGVDKGSVCLIAKEYGRIR